MVRLNYPGYPDPHRILAAHTDCGNFAFAAVHIPNREEGSPHECREQILRWATGWAGGPCVIIGDINTGQPGLDEECSFFNKREGAWFTNMAQSGWIDAWRHLHGDARVYSWRSPQLGTGFRIDQAFLNPEALALLESVEYLWLSQPDGSNASDHAALVLSFRN